MNFLNQHRLQDRCFTLDSPRDLNTSDRVLELFDFLQLKTRQPRIVLGGRRNQSLGHTTIIHPEDQREFEEVLAALPDHYLEIFRHEPYTRFAWNPQFQALWVASESSLNNVSQQSDS